jgi:hypothetical protein
MRADPLTVSPSEKRPADRDRQLLEVVWIATGEEAENLETDRAKKPAVRLKAGSHRHAPNSRSAYWIACCRALRPGEHLGDLIAAAFVHFPASFPASRDPRTRWRGNLLGSGRSMSRLLFADSRPLVNDLIYRSCSLT